MNLKLTVLVTTVGITSIIGACSSDNGSDAPNPPGNTGGSSAGAPPAGAPSAGTTSVAGTSSGGTGQAGSSPTAGQSGSAGSNPQAGSGGSSGSGGSAAGAPSGGSSAGQAGSGGQSTTGGTTGGGGTGGAQGGAPSAGNGGTPAGGGGAGGGGGGGAPVGSICPAGPFPAMPVPQGATPMRVEGVPPRDGFNDNGFGILEGPVWIGDALYLSEIGPDMNGDPRPAPNSRVLKVTSSGQVSVAIPDAGTNGLAIDSTGQLVGGNHKVGAITRFSLTGGAPTQIAAMFDNSRFNSPNDLAIRADGTIFFSDPNYQAPRPIPQKMTRVYRVAPNDSTATSIIEGRQQPNGVTLSPDGNTLYISGQDGVFAYPVMADGSIGGGTKLTNSITASDGMGMDCAGNLYVTTNTNVVVLAPDGMERGRIMVSDVDSVTNVAFGGRERKTLYITSLGSGDRRRLHKVDLAIPGLPY